MLFRSPATRRKLLQDDGAKGLRTGWPLCVPCSLSDLPASLLPVWLSLRIPSPGPQGTGFARQRGMELCRQEGDTCAWGMDASQGRHALMIELGVLYWSCLHPQGSREELWLGKAIMYTSQAHVMCENK